MHCHKKIRDVAMELAGGTYDIVMENNKVYTEWKRQNPGLEGVALRERFVARNWSKHIDAARTTLGLLLRSAIDDKAKEEIVEILALDQTLMRGRKEPQFIMGALPPQRG
jgi:hypothetical protein